MKIFSNMLQAQRWKKLMQILTVKPVRFSIAWYKYLFCIAMGLLLKIVIGKFSYGAPGS